MARMKDYCTDILCKVGAYDHGDIEDFYFEKTAVKGVMRVIVTYADGDVRVFLW